MNILLKTNIVVLAALVGLLAETVIAEDENTGKKLAVSVTMDKTGANVVMYTVYNSADTPVINTPNVQDAIKRYNAILVQADKYSGL